MSLNTYQWGCLLAAGSCIAALGVLDYNRHKRTLQSLEQEFDLLKDQSIGTHKRQPFKHYQSRKQFMQNTTLIYRICITGGEQSGRTTSIAKIQEVMQDSGFQVLIIQNNEDILIDKDNISMLNINQEQHNNLIVNNIKILLNITEYYQQLAEYGDIPTIIISDGGLLEIGMELDDNTWSGLAESGRVPNRNTLRDQYYDAVFHLVTMADGFPDAYYCYDESKQQQQYIQQAIDQDRAIQKLWTGHARHVIIKNEEKDFISKIYTLINYVRQLVGAPEIRTKWHKFIVDSVQFPSNIYKVKVTLTDTTLKPTSDKETVKLRKRQTDGVIQYYYIVSYQDGVNKIKGIKSLLTGTSYSQHLKGQDKSVKPLVRERISFTYDNQTFQLDCIQLKGSGSVGILRIQKESDKKGNQFRMPSWINVIKEVTDDPRYKTKKLATVA